MIRFFMVVVVLWVLMGCNKKLVLSTQDSIEVNALKFN
jgi:hypothetical protein